MPHTTPSPHTRGPAHFAGGAKNRLVLALVALTTLALALGTALVSTAQPAYAHASLVSSDPEEGSTLDAAPTEVTLTFNEEVREPAFVVVTAPDGKQQELDEPVITGEVITQTLDPDTEAATHPGGAWTVAYRVVSDDGHTVQGHVRFRVTGEAPSPTATTADSEEDQEDEESTSTRPNGNDSEDGSANTVLIGVVVALALALAAIALVRSRRNRA